MGGGGGERESGNGSCMFLVNLLNVKRVSTHHFKHVINVILQHQTIKSLWPQITTVSPRTSNALLLSWPSPLSVFLDLFTVFLQLHGSPAHCTWTEFGSRFVAVASVMLFITLWACPHLMHLSDIDLCGALCLSWWLSGVVFESPWRRVCSLFFFFFKLTWPSRSLQPWPT